MMNLLSIISIFLVVAFASGENLPEEFFGTFSHDRSENFDDYLYEEGYGWFTRRLVSLSGVDKVFTKTGPNTFNFDDLWTAKKLHYKDIVLGEEFIGEGLDGSDQKITFTFRDNVLYEKHVPTDEDAEQKEDEYQFHFEGDELVQTLESNGVVSKRYFIRE